MRFSTSCTEIPPATTPPPSSGVARAVLAALVVVATAGAGRTREPAVARRGRWGQSAAVAPLPLADGGGTSVGVLGGTFSAAFAAGVPEIGCAFLAAGAFLTGGAFAGAFLAGALAGAGACRRGPPVPRAAS